MKRFYFFAMVIGLLLAVPAVDVLGQDRSQEYVQARIERQVRREILRLPYYGVFDAIGFDVKGDTVTLGGYVLRPLTKKDAEDAVDDIEGIAKVINNIEVLPLSSADDRIRQRLLRAFETRGGSLYRYFLGANPSIRLIVKNGHVILEGNVDTNGDRNLANHVARGVSGTFSVTNNLKIIEVPR
jgi:hyperosmotically inducible periplasmic protein